MSGFLATAEDGRWAAYKDRYDRSVLTDDLVDLLRVIPDGDDTFRECFVDRAAHLVGSFAPGVVDSLPDGLRRQWSLVRERRIAELLQSIAREGVPCQVSRAAPADRTVASPTARSPHRSARMPDPDPGSGHALPLARVRSARCSTRRTSRPTGASSRSR